MSQPGETSPETVTVGSQAAVNLGEPDLRGEVSGSPASTRHIRLSWSRLSTYLRCGESFRLSYVEEVPKIPSGAAIAGRAVHEVIEEMTNEGWYANPAAVEDIGKYRFIEKFTDGVEEAGGAEACRWGGRKRNLKDEQGKDVVDPETGEKVKVGEDFRWMLQMGPTWVKRAGAILRRDIEMGLHVIEASVERQVTAWLIPPESGGPLTVDITGVVDVMLLADDYGAPRIRDWKTGTLLDPMQLAVYAWLLEQVPDESARISTTVGEMAYLRGTSSDSWLKPYDLTDWKPIVPNLFHGMVKGVEAEVFTLSPSSFCGSCWVKDACVYGRTLKD